MKHCWMGKGEYLQEKFGQTSEEYAQYEGSLWGCDEHNWGQRINPGHTCMLEDGHEGEHEFTSDAEIGVHFNQGN